MARGNYSLSPIRTKGIFAKRMIVLFQNHAHTPTALAKMLSNQQVKWCAFLVAKKGGMPTMVAKLTEAIHYAHYTMLRIDRASILTLAKFIDTAINVSRSHQTNLQAIGSGPAL